MFCCRVSQPDAKRFLNPDIHLLKSPQKTAGRVNCLKKNNNWTNDWINHIQADQSDLLFLPLRPASYSTRLPIGARGRAAFS